MRTAARSSRIIWGPRSRIGVADVRLAGVASAGGEWKAYARFLGESGRLILLSRESVLFDGRVESVDGKRVMLRTNGGREVVLKVPGAE